MEPVNVNEMSRISAGTTFKGEITTPTDIRVDGTFEGKICSKGRVVVGEKAQIKGDIICQNVDFNGTMHGNFYVKDTLSLKGSCVVVTSEEERKEGVIEDGLLTVDADKVTVLTAGLTWNE